MLHAKLLPKTPTRSDSMKAAVACRLTVALHPAHASCSWRRPRVASVALRSATVRLTPNRPLVACKQGLDGQGLDAVRHAHLTGSSACVDINRCLHACLTETQVFGTGANLTTIATGILGIGLWAVQSTVKKELGEKLGEKIEREVRESRNETRLTLNFSLAVAVISLLAVLFAAISLLFSVISV